ncbi:hypothetical protein [Telmatospirillum sp. J64-1]|uniref:hypothetical protein n=1 Tax=Telmatospirillum sp. J64-1 TaxID=2502183 RepID=UPI00115C98A6|nr:hypothetical protein [Telmatospirillum sp. J64-1]
MKSVYSDGKVRAQREAVGLTQRHGPAARSVAACKASAALSCGDLADWRFWAAVFRLLPQDKLKSARVRKRRPLPPRSPRISHSRPATRRLFSPLH